MILRLDENERYKLVKSDYLDAIKSIPDSSIDLILTDPPYNLANYSTGNMKFEWRAEINNDVAEWDEKPLNPSEFANEFKRILKPTGNIFIFCSYNLLGEYHKSLDPLFNTFQFMVWHKTNPIPNIRKSSFLNSCELIVCCWDKGHKWNFKRQNEMHNFIETPICMGKERVKNKEGKNAHPTQKPLSVLKHIIEISTNENDIVLDCFNGVGSTGEASLMLNRRYIGIDLDDEYIELSKERLSKYGN